MRTLVLGGIRSGKSHWAESAIDAREPVRYVATGPLADADDSSWAKRVSRHRDRRPATWRTVETTDVAAQLRAEPGVATLVDDVGGWLTAALDRAGWEGGSIAADVDELVTAVDGFAGSLVLVSPEVGLAVIPATESGRRFADELGLLNQRLAASCDRVVLVVAGLPVWVKPMEVPN